MCKDRSGSFLLSHCGLAELTGIRGNKPIFLTGDSNSVPAARERRAAGLEEGHFWRCRAKQSEPSYFRRCLVSKLRCRKEHFPETAEHEARKKSVVTALVQSPRSAQNHSSCSLGPDSLLAEPLLL